MHAGGLMGMWVTSNDGRWQSQRRRRAQGQAAGGASGIYIRTLFAGPRRRLCVGVGLAGPPVNRRVSIELHRGGPRSCLGLGQGREAHR